MLKECATAAGNHYTVRKRVHTRTTSGSIMPWVCTVAVDTGMIILALLVASVAVESFNMPKCKAHAHTPTMFSHHKLITSLYSIVHVGKSCMQLGRQ